jgi:hypothetical protein
MDLETGDAATREFARPLRALTVRSDGPDRGRTFDLARPASTIGRHAGCDLRLDDPYVSRRHAVVRSDGSGVTIADLGSQSGVLVNGLAIDGPTRLHHGDVVELARVVLELQDPSTARARPSEPPASRFDVSRQDGRIINNVGRDQIHNNRLALEIAPMKRRARRMLRTGWLVIVLGLGLQAGAMLVFFEDFRDQWNAPTPDPGSLPVDMLLLAAIGGVAQVVGVVLIITSLFIRRSARRREERL